MSDVIAYILFILVKGWPFIAVAFALTTLYTFVLRDAYFKLICYYNRKQIRKAEETLATINKYGRSEYLSDREIKEYLMASKWYDSYCIKNGWKHK